MIVSWNWLTEYVRLDVAVDVLTERLALAGLNHESTEDVGGDLAIDLEVTSNRPDCLSHIGVAREVGVLFGKDLCEPDPRPREKGPGVETRTAVAIEAPDLCPRFTARVVSGVTIGESPWWLCKRLETLGVRPISNIVDITNYVMFECGQPLHAYDLDRLAGRRLVVRQARPGELLRAINGKTYELSPEMLAIADAERPVGLAGVMGGLDTEIGPETKNILIEAAQFDPMSVRKTSRALGLFSPSSYRFERPMDPERTEWASRRCAGLVLELAGGRLHPGVIDAGTPPSERPVIVLRLDQVLRVLGITIDRAEVIRILRALGLEPLDESEHSLMYRPPSWRADLEREIDLIEEVARIHGYHHIPEDRPVPLTRSARGPRERIETEVRAVLTGLGFDEAATFSLVSEELIVPSSTDTEAPAPIRVDHSSRKRENLLRTSLVPSLLAARAYNEAHGNADAALFEIANVYLPRPDRPLPDEPARLALVAGLDFLGMKGVVEGLLGRLHAERDLEVQPTSHPLYAPGRVAELTLAGVPLGLVGEIAPERLESLGVRAGSAAAELTFEVLQEKAQLIPHYRPLPAFPTVSRDLSLVVTRTLPWGDLARVVREAAGPVLEALEYLDVFAGGDLPVDKHSLHFGLRFRHSERTLTGEDVEQAVQTIVDACAQRFGATLRM
jgi:phenylalanyl-tRNA synthetase beta chain